VYTENSQQVMFKLAQKSKCFATEMITVKFVTVETVHMNWSVQTDSQMNTTSQELVASCLESSAQLQCMAPESNYMQTYSSCTSSFCTNYRTKNTLQVFHQ